MVRTLVVAHWSIRSSNNTWITSTTTGVAALTAQQEVNNGGYNIIEGADNGSSSSTVFYASHNGRVIKLKKIIFGSDTSANNVLDDYEIVIGVR